MKTTHFDNNGKNACGRKAVRIESTSNAFSVDCFLCRRTKVYKDAHKRQSELREKKYDRFAQFGLDPEKPVCEMTPEEIKLFKEMRMS